MESISIEDRQTGRSVVVRRPLNDYFTSSELIALEDTVWAWGNLAAEEQAEQALDRMAAGSPERVLYGLLWLTGVWCTLCHARFDVPLHDFIGQLDYRGLRRDLSGLDEQQWATGTHLVRRGVRAVVDSDADAREYLRIMKKIEPSLLRLRRHLLTILDGLTQDMQRNGLAPWGSAAHILTGAGWTD